MWEIFSSCFVAFNLWQEIHIEPKPAALIMSQFSTMNDVSQCVKSVPLLLKLPVSKIPQAC